MSALSTFGLPDTQTTIELRPGLPEDAEAAGRICHQAFTALASQHGFPSDFPAPEIGIGMMTMEGNIWPPGATERSWHDDSNLFEIAFDSEGYVVGYHKRTSYRRSPPDNMLNRLRQFFRSRLGF